MAASEFMAYLLIGAFLAGVAAGLLIAFVLKRGTFGEMRHEIEELRWRLANAESVVSRGRRGAWRQLDEKAEGASLGAEDTPLDGDEQSTLSIQYDPEGDEFEERPESLNASEAGALRKPGSPAGRRVRAIKVLGPDAKFRINDSFEGMEDGPPVRGKPYRVHREDNFVIRTSPVVSVSPPYIQTMNSVYRIEVLAGGDSSRGQVTPPDESQEDKG